MKTVAVFFADGFEEIEAITPVDYLRRAGVEVYTVAVPSPTMTDKYIVTSSHNIPMIMDMTFEEYLDACKEGLPDGLFFPGGSKGAENLGSNKDILGHIEKAYDDGKIISAICASPAVVLGKTKVLKDKKWTCYPDMENCANSDFIKGHTEDSFVSDGNVVTSRGAGTSEVFAMELVRIFAGEETAAKIKKGTIQR